MKTILITTFLLSNLAVFAKSTSKPTVIKPVVVENNKVEAVVTKLGVYSRLLDIQEGIEHVQGIEVNNTTTHINPQGEVSEVILHNGTTINIGAKVLDGGDMGGGGS